ncbi:MAG: type II toxin-antitoxin system VapC family toxin [Nitrospinae bacterium]|nr:type II toxin-antitoxin system VapC family toxin [Nitrospinota bacterium]
MRFVVDASVAVKWLIEEEGSESAKWLLEGEHELHAPRLMVSEIANALRRRTRMGDVQLGEAGELVSIVPEMPLHWADDEKVCADAVRIAIALDASVYDCIYLALAHRVGAKLVTADDRFVNVVAATEHGGAVTTLADLAVESE